MAKRKEKDARYMAFLQDIAKAMALHGVTDMVCISMFDNKLRNTYLPMGESEDELFCHISDAMDAWLRQSFNN